MVNRNLERLRGRKKGDLGGYLSAAYEGVLLTREAIEDITYFANRLTGRIEYFGSLDEVPKMIRNSPLCAEGSILMKIYPDREFGTIEDVRLPHGMTPRAKSVLEKSFSAYNESK